MILKVSHKDYKEKYAELFMDKRGELKIHPLCNLGQRGQATIFVIVAILIVAAIVIVYLYFPNITQIVTGGEFSPNSYLKDCVDDTIYESITLLSKQGGYSNPEGFVLYEGEKVKYLCYGSEYYQTCAIQQPMIKNHFEVEMEALVNKKANECVRDLKSEYESRGYGVKLGEVSNNVEIVPGAIKVNFDTDMSISKDTTRNFDGFEVDISSEMYDLLLTAQSVIDFEATYGDSETTAYMQYYPDLRMEKIKLSDGTKIYKLSNVVTGEEFVFASRSLAWPPGYGLG